MQVEFYKHSLGSAEKAALLKALDGLFLTSGPLTQQFEANFARYLGCRRVVGTYSCTTALFLCLKALGIGPGDEVITTPMTFIATANAILEAGAQPVFADVEPGGGNLDPARVRAALTPRTKALLPVHLYGNMCDMRSLARIAADHKLYLIEDAAHCIEGERDGIRPGKLSDAACFSFYATKNMTCGEGGAIATNRVELAESLLRLRSHGMDKAAAERYTGHYRHWDMPTLGYKGNMFDIQAALLLPQIERLDELHRRRLEIRRFYDQALAAAGKGVQPPPKAPPGTKPACHLYTILAERGRRDEFLLQLQQQGIGVAVNYRPVHLMQYYRERFGYREGMFPNAEDIGERTISLPLYPGLKPQEIEAVAAAVLQTAHALECADPSPP